MVYLFQVIICVCCCCTLILVAQEETVLRKGVTRFGAGNWKEILMAYQHVFKVEELCFV
jgi:hypothetical protein